MARNGSGVQSSPGASFPAVASTLIESAKFNAVINDINNVLTTSIATDGQTTITADIPLNSHKLTGLSSGSARTDSPTLGQVQDAIVNWVAAGGTADAITATYSPAITSLVDGQICFVRASTNNLTTTPTFSPSGLTARTIVKYGNQALEIGSIRANGHELILRYNLAATTWELLNPITKDIVGNVTGNLTGTASAASSLTSGATGVTPAIGDSSTKVATTEFVFQNPSIPNFVKQFFPTF